MKLQNSIEDTLTLLLHCYEVGILPTQVAYLLRCINTENDRSEIEHAIYGDYIQARNGLNTQTADYILKVVERLN